MTEAIAINNTGQLYYAWAELRKRQPGLALRDAAIHLGVSELQLMMLDNAAGVRPLRFQRKFDLLTNLATMGELVALARNDYCLHEIKGHFSRPRGSHQLALTSGQQEQRLFLPRWQHILACKHDDRHSIQIFDTYGNALWKLFRTAQTNRRAWQHCINNHACLEFPKATPHLSSVKPALSLDRDINPLQQALLKQWDRLRDIHEFYPLLKRLEICKWQAYCLAEHHWTRRVKTSSLIRVLVTAMRDKLPLQIHTANHGLVQVFRGPIHNLRRSGVWFNVLDLAFKLHINTEKIREVWHVTRPTLDGNINTIDCFDDSGYCVVSLFGDQPDGELEHRHWRALLESMENLPDS